MTKGIFQPKQERRKSSLDSNATANPGASGSTKEKGGTTDMSSSEIASALEEQDARAARKLNESPAPALGSHTSAEIQTVRQDIAALSRTLTSAIEAVGKNAAAAAQKSQTAEANGQALQDTVSQLAKAVDGLSRKLDAMSGRLDTAVNKLDKVADETHTVSSAVSKLQTSLPKAETFQRLNNDPAPAKERDYGAEERKRIEALDAIYNARPVVHGVWFGKKFYLDSDYANAAAEKLTGDKAKDSDLVDGHAYVHLSDPDKPYSAQLDDVGAVFGAEWAPPEAYANYVAQRKQASWTIPQATSSSATGAKPAPAEE